LVLGGWDRMMDQVIAGRRAIGVTITACVTGLVYPKPLYGTYNEEYFNRCIKRAGGGVLRSC
jgi:hypothetical protein